MSFTPRAPCDATTCQPDSENEEADEILPTAESTNELGTHPYSDHYIVPFLFRD